MLIKKKSLIVALISGLVISAVLVLTLLGYVFYIELKGKEFKRSYQELLSKINAKVYSKHIDISKLNAKVETSGALKGKPIVEGLIRNNGTREITNILIKVNILDRDGSVLYEIAFHPQEPALGSSILPNVSIPYFGTPAKTILRPGNDMPFKRILAYCPKEILSELDRGMNFSKTSGKWSGNLSSEVLSVDF